jgi:hypothetical protein
VNRITSPGPGQYEDKGQVIKLKATSFAFSKADRKMSHANKSVDVPMDESQISTRQIYNNSPRTAFGKEVRENYTDRKFLTRSIPGPGMYESNSHKIGTAGPSYCIGSRL